MPETTETPVTTAAPAAGTADKRAVSTTRGQLAGGYCFAARAADVTSVPTGIVGKDELVAAGYTNAGYLGSDGITESVDGGSTDQTDFNGDVVDTTSEAKTESIVMKFLSMEEVGLSIMFGHDNVAVDAESGRVTVSHNWTSADEVLSIVLLLALKDGRKWVKVIPQCKVSEFGEMTISREELAGREVTFKYLTDDDGCGCVDYIEAVA